MDESLKPRKRGKVTNWKVNVEGDLRRLLDKKGAIGAFLLSKNGDTIMQAFEGTKAQKEAALMQFVKKIVPTIISLRNAPLRRSMFETKEGTVMFYVMDNGILGCLLDKDADLLSILVEIRAVGDMISGHLNNGDIAQEKLDNIQKENREEFKAFNSGFLKELEKHYGPIITEQLIQRTVR